MRPQILMKNTNWMIAGMSGLLLAILVPSIFFLRTYPFSGKADCGNLCDPTWWSTVEPEGLVAELAYRGLNERNYDREPFSPLHFAVLFSENTQVEMLVNAGASINAVDYHGSTPLMTLVSQSTYTCSMKEGSSMHYTLVQRLKYLIDIGADVTISDHQGQTALHLTHASFADILIAGGADLNAQDNYGRTPFHNSLTPNAFGQINEELTNVLLLAGADADISDKDGITPRSLMR